MSCSDYLCRQTSLLSFRLRLSTLILVSFTGVTATFGQSIQDSMAPSARDVAFAGQLSGLTIDLGYVTAGAGLHGVRFGVSCPFGYVPRVLGDGRIADRHWLVSLSWTGFDTYQGDYSWQLQLGVQREHIRPRGFMWSYGFLAGYAQTNVGTVVVFEGNGLLTVASYKTNGVAFGPTARLGYDFSRKLAVPLRLWVGPQLSLKFFDEELLSYGGFAHATLTAGASIELFGARGRKVRKVK